MNCIYIIAGVLVGTSPESPATMALLFNQQLNAARVSANRAATPPQVALRPAVLHKETNIQLMQPLCATTLRQQVRAQAAMVSCIWFICSSS